MVLSPNINLNYLLCNMIAILLIIIGSVLIIGLINKIRAFMAGREGTRFFQPLYTAKVLMQKAPVYGKETSWVTRLAAPFYLAAVLLAMLTIPLGGIDSALISFNGDIVLFCILLTLSRISLVWAALDSGSSFQGMGASRESLFALLVEPAMMILFATLAMVTGVSSFSSMFHILNNISLVMIVISVVVGYGVLKLAFVECGRLPIDDVRTHLELTMIHEVMVLDIAGIDLAYIKIAGWLKLSGFVMLLLNIMLPPHFELWSVVLLYFAALVAFALIVGVVESFSARNRMNKNATYITTILAVGLLAYIVGLLLKLGVIA